MHIGEPPKHASSVRRNAAKYTVFADGASEFTFDRGPRCGSDTLHFFPKDVQTSEQIQD